MWFLRKKGTEEFALQIAGGCRQPPLRKHDQTWCVGVDAHIDPVQAVQTKNVIAPQGYFVTASGSGASKAWQSKILLTAFVSGTDL